MLVGAYPINGRLSNPRWQQTYRVSFHCLRSSEHAHITENNGFYLVKLLPPSVLKVSHCVKHRGKLVTLQRKMLKCPWSSSSECVTAHVQCWSVVSHRSTKCSHSHFLMVAINVGHDKICVVCWLFLAKENFEICKKLHSLDWGRPYYLPFSDFFYCVKSLVFGFHVVLFLNQYSSISHFENRCFQDGVSNKHQQSRAKDEVTAMVFNKWVLWEYAEMQTFLFQ